MPDLLKTGSEWLERKRTEHATRTVTYVRGAESVEVAASIGRTVFRLDKGYGVTEHVEARDYLVLTDDLGLGGAPEFPQAGDRIHEAEGDKDFIYEVMAPGNEPCWRYSDPYKQALRIHTKHVGTEDI